MSLRERCAQALTLGLSGELGMTFEDASEDGTITLGLDIEQRHLAPNGYLHAGTVVALADTATGFGCMICLSEGSKGFTTIELKCNHLGTARSGRITATAKPVHLGRSTHVWDAEVRHVDKDRVIAQFRCTQMILK